MRPHSQLKHAEPVLVVPGPASSHEAAVSSFHFLHAGQVFVSTAGESIVLILGSCVGVCIWDAVNSIGGATHFLLPHWDGTGVASPRYGNVAISILVQKVLESGANRSQLRAKVFGGGCLFDSMREAGSQKEQHLGSRNVEMALETLTKAQILVVSTVVGADRGQRIVFHTNTGDAEIKVL
jgi:chemotaxis protein CheD